MSREAAVSGVELNIPFEFACGKWVKWSFWLHAIPHLPVAVVVQHSI